MQWEDGWPDWCDDGRQVEITQDGFATQGTLTFDEWASDGEGNECPIWELKLSTGAVVSFCMHDKWRFLEG